MKTVTAAIIIEDGRVMLARRGADQTLAGYWEFPGGKLESGESLQDCLRRELSEEFSVDAEVGEVFAESTYRYEHGEFHLVGLITTLADRDLKLSVHDAVKWFPVAELSDVRLAPADIPIALKIQREYPEA